MTPYEMADECLSQAIRFRSAWRSARRRARARGENFHKMLQLHALRGVELDETRAKLEHYRVQLRDAHNDLLNMRGILSPNGEQPKTPLPLAPTVAPAVEWLVAEVERYRLAHLKAVTRADVGRDRWYQTATRLELSAKRYRLAWTSARQRAMNHLLALVAADDERDALRTLVRSVQMYGTGYLYRDSNGVDHLLSPADVTVFTSADRETELERLTRERDEARAEVVRLGKELERADLTNASMRAALDEVDAE